MFVPCVLCVLENEDALLTTSSLSYHSTSVFCDDNLVLKEFHELSS